MALPLLIILSLFLSLLFFLIIRLTHPSAFPNHKLPPGPFPLPFIGNIHNLSGGLPHRLIRDLSKRHGPLLHLKLGEIHYIIANSPSTARAILHTHDLAFASRPVLMAIRTVAYNCVGMGFSPYGPYWRQLRKICNVDLLSNKRVRSFASVRQQEIARAVSEIRALGPHAVDMTEIFLGLTNNHLARAALGKECGRRQRFLNAMRETISLAPMLSLMDLFPSLGFWISKFSGKMLEMKRLHAEMDMVLDEIIEDHRIRCSSVAGEVAEVTDGEDLVDILLRVQGSGELDIPIDMVHVKAVILDLLVAATETTSSTLDWVMSELIRNPDVMQKVQSEIREAVAATGKATIEESDVERLPYLKRVIKETLRLHPPLPLLLPRTCNGGSVDLMGFSVPSDSRIMVNAWAIGRDPEVWKDPERFCPDRFLESGVSADFKNGSFEYIPFGGGRRICPGVSFAMAGMELFLAALLFHFEWKTPGGMNPEELDMEEQFDGSLRRKNHLFLHALPI